MRPLCVLRGLLGERARICVWGAAAEPIGSCSGRRVNKRTAPLHYCGCPDARTFVAFSLLLTSVSVALSHVIALLFVLALGAAAAEGEEGPVGLRRAGGRCSRSRP